MNLNQLLERKVYFLICILKGKEPLRMVTALLNNPLTNLVLGFIEVLPCFCCSVWQLVILCFPRWPRFPSLSFDWPSDSKLELIVSKINSCMLSSFIPCFHTWDCHSYRTVSLPHAPDDTHFLLPSRDWVSLWCTSSRLSQLSHFCDCFLCMSRLLSTIISTVFDSLTISSISDNLYISDLFRHRFVYLTSCPM